jgi:hypothetical protein
MGEWEALFQGEMSPVPTELEARWAQSCSGRFTEETKLLRCKESNQYSSSVHPWLNNYTKWVIAAVRILKHYTLFFLKEVR